MTQPVNSVHDDRWTRSNQDTIRCDPQGYQQHAAHKQPITPDELHVLDLLCCDTTPALHTLNLNIQVFS